MRFLRWIGGIVVLFWIIGLLFRIAGTAIHFLLIIAAIAFIADWISNKSSKSK